MPVAPPGAPGDVYAKQQPLQRRRPPLGVVSRSGRPGRSCSLQEGGKACICRPFRFIGETGSMASWQQARHSSCFGFASLHRADREDVCFGSRSGPTERCRFFDRDTCTVRRRLEPAPDRVVAVRLMPLRRPWCDGASTSAPRPWRARLPCPSRAAPSAARCGPRARPSAPRRAPRRSPARPRRPAGA